MKFVSRYTREICYGGPEEGGWWYDWNTYDELIAICPDEENAISVCRALNIKQQTDDKEQNIDYYSVNADPHFIYDVEDFPAQNESTERPRYE
jgi:hypothetical protein